MHPANAGGPRGLELTGRVDEDLLQILFDPQTSGGLLLGVAPQRTGKLLDALRGGDPRRPVSLARWWRAPRRLPAAEVAVG